MLHQGKRYLEQQSVDDNKNLGFKNTEDQNNVLESGRRVKIEEAFETASDMFGIEDIDAPQMLDRDLEFVGKQDAKMVEKSVSRQMCIGVSGDVQPSRSERQWEQLKTSPTRSKLGLEKGVTEDVTVEIIEPYLGEDVWLDPESQASECSSSFDGTQNDFATDEVDCQIESQPHDRNGATVLADRPLRNNRALTAEWKTYRQGIEWRCRWLELRFKELLAQSVKYDKILRTARSHKQQLLEQQDRPASRADPMVDLTKKKYILQRQRRRKAEDSVMSWHPLFSRYEKQKEHEQKVERTAVISDEESHQMFESDNLNRLGDQEVDDELGEEFDSEEDSMEQLLWHIEALQMHVMKLKKNLIRGVPSLRNLSIVQFRNLASSSTPTLGHPLPLEPPMSNVMTNYVEPAKSAFIETPYWAYLDEAAAGAIEGSSDEDTDDKLYRRGHLDMEVKDEEQEFLHTFEKGSSKSGSKRLRQASGKGTWDGVFVVNDSDLPTDIGFVPK